MSLADLATVRISNEPFTIPCASRLGTVRYIKAARAPWTEPIDDDGHDTYPSPPPMLPPPRKALGDVPCYFCGNRAEVYVSGDVPSCGRHG